MNKTPGEEPGAVTDNVTKTSTAVAYEMQQLHARATQLLAAQVTQRFGTGYLLNGEEQASVTRATATPTTAGVVLAFTCAGTYAYILNEQAQQSIKTLIAGKPRLAALRLLLQQTGIQTASISGIADNQPLPNDQAHLHLQIVLTLF